MGTFHEVAVATASFLGLIIVMVFVHEMGHFLAAKACRVHVKAFALGIGPRLFGFHVGETDYRTCLFPVGGYVKMSGDESGDPIAPGSFNAHPRWQRVLICFAGPAANFMLAFCLMAVYYAAFNETPKLNLKTPTVDWVVPGSDAARAGIQAGDVIESFDSLQNPDWNHLHNRAEARSGQVVPVTVIRAGHPLSLALQMPDTAKFGVEDMGLLPNLTGSPIGIAYVKPGAPAASAGMRKGDQIVTVNGLKVHFIDTLTSYIETTKGKSITLGVLRNGAEQFMRVKPRLVGGSWRIGVHAAGFPIKDSPLPFGSAVRKAAHYCVSGATMIVKTVNHLVTHQVSVKQVSGPIGVARLAGEAAQSRYWFQKFSLTAIVSLNLALFNLLPLPILDGGLIVMLLFEGIRRKDISATTKARIRKLSLAVIGVFFVATLLGDVSNLGFFASAAKNTEIALWAFVASALAGYFFYARALLRRVRKFPISDLISTPRKEETSGNSRRDIIFTTETHG